MCRTRVPGRVLPNTRSWSDTGSGSDPNSAGFLGADTRVPEHPAQTSTRVPVWQRVPVVNMPGDPNSAGFLGADTRVPEYPARTSTRVPVWQRVPVVNMPGSNLQKPFKHATNDPAQYLNNTYQLLRMQLRWSSMIMSISGRAPGYPGIRLTWVPEYPGTRVPV